MLESAGGKCQARVSTARHIPERKATGGGGEGVSQGKERGVRAWVIDSEKEKAMGERQRNSMDHQKGSPERRKPTEQERNRNGT